MEASENELSKLRRQKERREKQLAEKEQREKLEREREEELQALREAKGIPEVIKSAPAKKRGGSKPKKGKKK